MIKKIAILFTSILGLFAFTLVPAFAHVIVTPHQVGIAATQDFTVNVPNEKDNPVVSVRLLMPDGLSSVVPNTVPGWTIDTKKKGSGDNAPITEIDWTGGSIPVGQRAEFIFQAQVPEKLTTLVWKAYQTYSDGTVVSWDIDPAAMKNVSDKQQDAMADKQNKGVYSTTQIINDLTGTTTGTTTNNLANQIQWLNFVSIGALVLSVFGILLALRKK